MTFHLLDNKPLVAVWGVGFNDGRAYGLPDAAKIIKGLKNKGFSIMLGVPTYWRELREDTENDSKVHDLILQCDIVMPWFVGRYNESGFKDFSRNITKILTGATGTEWTMLHSVFLDFLGRI